YMYFLGSPYKSPFIKGEKPNPELSDFLKRSCDLAFEVSLPLPADHLLHHKAITGIESGGMKPSWIDSRREHGLGPYTRINILIVVGQRSNHRTNHEVSIEREQRNWLERYKEFPHGAKTNSFMPLIQIMSYDRLLADGAGE